MEYDSREIFTLKIIPDDTEQYGSYIYYFPESTEMAKLNPREIS